MPNHVHSDACCKWGVSTEGPLLLASVRCLNCERDTANPVKLMRYAGVVVTDGCEACRPEPEEDKEPVGAGALMTTNGTEGH